MTTERLLYVGIDLGTTNSAAAIFDGTRVDPVRSAQGGVLTPSVVRIDARGKVTVGARARKLLEQDPDNTRTEFKRLMGSQQILRFPAAGVEKKPEELAAEVLRAIRDDVRAQTGVLPTRAVISVPALFELPQTSATSEAARLAGFERVEMIQEPIASGLAAGLRAEGENGSFLVYDLGGGTFDVSLLETKDGLLRVVGHDGDNFLGGRDFDAAIVDHAIEAVRRETGILVQRQNPEHATALRRIRAIAEEAKIELSRAGEADLVLEGVTIDGKDLQTTVTLDRSTLERLVDPLVERTLEICRRLLTSRGLPHANSVARIVLVGGPTTMPFLRRRVADAFGAPFGEGLDPMTLVAEGAAYYAATSGLPARGEPKAERAGAKVWLQYPAVSSDLNPFVVGKLLNAADRERIRDVVLTRGAGEWVSEPERLDHEGTFAAMTSLAPRRQNVLTIEGRDAEGRKIPLSPDEIVIVHGVTVGDPPLSRSVGVALAQDRVCVFFERGVPLPMRRTFTLRTASALSPADPEGALRVPIVQGEFPIAHLCRLVGSIELRASALTSPVPANSAVEVTIELDRGGRLSATACLAQSSEVFQHVAHLVAGRLPLAELRARFNETKNRLQQVRAKAFRAGAQKAVTGLAAADSLAFEGERAVEAAQGGEEDAEEKAQRLLVDLDALVADAEATMAWPDLESRAQMRIASAARWVGDFGTAEEQSALAGSIAAFHRARAAANARDAQLHLDAIGGLASVAALRRPGAWRDALDDCAGDIATARDPRSAQRLLEEGRRAADRGDELALKNAVRAIWELLPRGEHTPGGAHGSGVS